MVQIFDANGRMGATQPVSLHKSCLILNLRNHSKAMHKKSRSFVTELSQECQSPELGKGFALNPVTHSTEKNTVRAVKLVGSDCSCQH